MGIPVRTPPEGQRYEKQAPPPFKFIAGAGDGALALDEQGRPWVLAYPGDLSGPMAWYRIEAPAMAVVE
jgi:hypothetical protein